MEAKYEQLIKDLAEFHGLPEKEIRWICNFEGNPRPIDNLEELLEVGKSFGIKW